MNEPKWTTWIYLLVSAGLSYWLISQERSGNNGGDLLITWAHGVRKVARRIDAELTTFIDKELEHRRTV